MGLRDEAAEDFVKLGFAERFLHLGNAEQFLFVGVVTGGNDRCGCEPFVCVLAVGAFLDNLPSVPCLTADGGLQGIFLDVVCPGNEVIDLGENLFDLLIGEKRRFGEVVSGKSKVRSGAFPAVRLLGTRDVKGVALKTHEGRCPSTLQAFKKA